MSLSTSIAESMPNLASPSQARDMLAWMRTHHNALRDMVTWVLPPVMLPMLDMVFAKPTQEDSSQTFTNPQALARLSTFRDIIRGMMGTGVFYLGKTFTATTLQTLTHARSESPLPQLASTTVGVVASTVFNGTVANRLALALAKHFTPASVTNKPDTNLEPAALASSPLFQPPAKPSSITLAPTDPLWPALSPLQQANVSFSMASLAPTLSAATHWQKPLGYTTALMLQSGLSPPNTALLPASRFSALPSPRGTTVPISHPGAIYCLPT